MLLQVRDLPTIFDFRNKVEEIVSSAKTFRAAPVNHNDILFLRFMRTTLLCILSAIILLMAMSCTQDSAGEYYLFVGTYTGEGSEGIYVYRFNTNDGTYEPADTVSGVENPSYLTITPDHSNLYAVNEMADSARATVSAFRFDKQSGKLTFLNKRSSGGGAPCYISTDKQGKAVFAGNYLGGSLSMYPISDNGALGEATGTISHTGSSINSSRQESPHVHCTIISPDNSYLFAVDLGTDRVSAYDFNEDNVDWTEEPSFVYETEAGAGPRHLTFHPNGNYAYLINELNGTVVAFQYHSGSLTAIQTVSNLPENYDGTISGADIRISPDGKFLYASNREDLNNIVIYTIDNSSGMLTKIGEQSSGGVHPRNFTIDPSGQFLLVANRHTDNIVVFQRDLKTGLLTPTGTEIEVSQPVSLQMVPAN